MSDILAPISQGISGVQSFLTGNSKAVLVPNVPGFPTTANELAGGWVFDIPTGENEDFESDITDHYTESGSFINDHIVNKPIRVTLTGLVGELVYRKPSGLFGALNQVAGRLSQVAAYAGNYSPGFVQKVQGIVGKAQAVAAQVDNYVSQAQNAVKSVSSLLGLDSGAQKKAYDLIYGLWAQKTLFTVTTPWAKHSCMAIASMGFRQDQDSDDYSTITITLKEFRFAQTKLTVFKGDDQNINAIQTSDPQTQGKVGGNLTALQGISSGHPDLISTQGIGQFTAGFGGGPK